MSQTLQVRGHDAPRDGDDSHRNPPRTPFARLGRWTATHFRTVLLAWGIILVIFGAFAPTVETALAGAGWQDSSSQSVQARNIIQRDFSGLGAAALDVVIVDHNGPIASDHNAQAAIGKAAALLRADPRVSVVVLPRAGISISRDGRTAIITAGSAVGTNAMVKAADALAVPLQNLSGVGMTVVLTGDSALWSDFNNANRSAMLRSEMLSWPVTMIILVIAFGSLVAAGLPLLLTMVGLLVAAGALVMSSHVAPVSIWALNFALMFALALGIDYALFLVVRVRPPHKRRRATSGDTDVIVAAVAETMDTAGKAVAFSAMTVLASLAAILLVPSPAFRSMALGIMLSVIAVLAATLTLLPAVLGRLGPRINAGKVRIGRKHLDPDHPGRLDAMLHSWGKALWKHPTIFGLGALAVLLLAAAPVIGMRTNMPSITIIPANANARIGYNEVSAAFGEGANGTLQVLVPATHQKEAMATLSALRGVQATTPGPSNSGWTLDQVVPTTGPSTTATEATISRMRLGLPAGSLVGGAAAENYDLQQSLSRYTLLVFGVLLALGFILLLIALGAPLIAAAGVLLTGLSVAGAFGVARLIFQDGHLAGLLNFHPQGFVDAWGPLFFGAMVFGVAMDYTLFILSAAKGSYEMHEDPEHAMVGSVRTSGRVVVSAAAVMIAVFLTFALSGPLAPKEMGVILAVAVALDAIVVRMVLLPVVLRYGRHLSWHQPKWLGKVLPKIRFSH